MADRGPVPEDEPFALAARAGVELARRTGVERHDLFVVLGSGWSRAVDAFPVGIDVPMSELPGFPAPSVPGHLGSMRSFALGSRRVLVAQGRVHLYEGYPPATVAHAVRTAAAAGCRTVILTNASGVLHPEWPIGVPVVVRDQINLTGLSPLTGAGPPIGQPGRFADMSDIYTVALRTLVHDVAPGLSEGVYAGVHGPEFETPAEIRAAARLGADLCGMSTVLEAIAASHLRLDVLGLSLVTNLAAGLGDRRLSVDDVVAVADAAAPRVTDLLRRVVGTIADAEVA